MNNDLQVDIDLLKNSSTTITGIMNLVDNSTLESPFIELENQFKMINFEHANPLTYKDYIERIYNKLADIKEKIHTLYEMLNTTIDNVDELEKMNESDLSKLSSAYSNQKSNLNFRIDTEIGENNISNTTDNVTKVPPIEQNSIEEKPVSTVPIGIAIGTTGIAGSVGAVVVNEKYGQDAIEENVEKYDDTEDKNLDFDVKVDKKIEDDATPYHASRLEREAEKYYGNEEDQEKELELSDYDEDVDNNDYDE